MADSTPLPVPFGQFQDEIYLAGVDPMEEVARRVRRHPGLLPAVHAADRELAESLLRHAEAAGFRAIVVTLDTWGRPCTYGLAIGGTDGIVHVLRAMPAEADLIMAVDGYPRLAGLTRSPPPGGLLSVRRATGR